MNIIINVTSFAFVLMALTACNTLSETGEPYDSSTGYERVSVEGQSDKFVRSRLVSTNDNHWPQPMGQSKPYLSLDSNRSAAVSESPSATVRSGDTKLYLGLNLSSSSRDKIVHSGAMLDFNWQKKYSFLVGVSFFSSDKLYFGGDIGLRAYFPWQVSPFIGLGGYLGDSKKCTLQNISSGLAVETCEKFFLATLYPELGIQMLAGENFKLAIYVRDYSKIDQSIRDRSYALWGASVAYQF